MVNIPKLWLRTKKEKDGVVHPPHYMKNPLCLYGKYTAYSTTGALWNSMMLEV